MKKIVAIIMITLCCGGIVTADTQVKKQTVIEKGDTLLVYVVDQHGTDLVEGSFQQGPLSSRDPHELRVSSEGRLYVPNVGVLDVMGKTPYEVEQLIRDKIDPAVYLHDVAVLVVSPQFNRVYVLGEVASPGMYKIDRVQPFEMKLMNVVGMAGGFTDRANRNEVQIVKADGKRVTVNVRELVSDCCPENNIALEDKDTVVVSQAVERVYVLGEVGKPGGYPFIQGASVADYVAEAGGVNKIAAHDNIGIFRKGNPKNIVYKTALNQGYIANGKQPALRQGDIIYVPKNFWADWGDIATFLGMTRDSILIYDTLSLYRFK